MLKVAFVSSRLDFNDGVASHVELLASQLVSRGAKLTMITGLTTGSYCDTIAAVVYRVDHVSMKLTEDYLLTL